MLRTTLAATLLAGSTLAQVQNPLSIIQTFLPVLSSECRETISNLTNSSSPQYQCLRVDALLPAIFTNDSIIPPVNEYLTQVCSSAPCNSSVVNDTATAVVQGCGADLQKFGISSDIVSEVIGYYPLARSVACLKNEKEEVLANATIPLNSTLFNMTGYVNMTLPANWSMPSNISMMGNSTNSTMSNSTQLINGTFCLTEFATNITGYLGVNLTNSYIDTALLGGNYSAIQAIESIPRTALCSDCVFAAVNLINEEIPAFGNLVVNRTANVTINSYLDGICSAEGYNATGNGTLPEDIYEGAVNSTLFPSNATSYTNETMTMMSSASGNSTSTVMPMPSANATAPAPGPAMTSIASEITSAGAASITSAASAATSGAMAEKRRWFGKE